MFQQQSAFTQSSSRGWGGDPRSRLIGFREKRRKGNSKGGKEEETTEWREWWTDELNRLKKKINVCSSLLEVLFFSLVRLLLGVPGRVKGQVMMVGWEAGGSKVIVGCVCLSAGYQLLSGEGSLSRCMAALWCFMLSKYSCWETASTDARISSSSQSVRPGTHRAASQSSVTARGYVEFITKHLMVVTPRSTSSSWSPEDAHLPF